MRRYSVCMDVPLPRLAGVRALAAAVPLMAGGCAVGPTFHRPAAPAGAAYTSAPLPPQTAAASVAAGDAQRFLSGHDVAFEWWREFGSTALDARVAQALRANPSVAAAQAALRAAQELVYAQRGYFYPTVGVGYAFERQQIEGNVATTQAPGVQGNGENLVPSGPAQPLIYNLHTAQLTVGYTPDVFGGNRRKVESLEAQADVQRFELEATYVTLASNVVAASVEEAATRAQLAASKEIVTLGERALEVTDTKYARGYASALDVAAAQAQLAAARALLPPLERQLTETLDLLRVLLGRLPNADLGAPLELEALHLPRELPLSLPAKLIEQRPDVRAAEEQMRSANAEVGVAAAAMFPQFTIDAAAGGAANEFDWMFRDGGPFWSLIAGVTQPLFAGGTLLHTRRAAEQALQQAAAQYRETVLAAYQNVADTLAAVLADARALESAAGAEEAARSTLDLTREQQREGFADPLTELAAHVAERQAMLALVQVQAMRFGDTAALYQALGGGWWNRAAAAPAARAD